MTKWTFILPVFLLLLYSCKTEPKPIVVPDQKLVLVDAPSFDEDSAYFYVEQQVAFGPRVPNTTGHENTKDWLIQFFNDQNATVIEQKANLTAFNGEVLKSTNIIASFNPDVDNRILLCAHWDTRPFADQDDEKSDEPILGANDGASGVAVLLEIARQINLNPITLGVDIILFDSEDYGQPANSGFAYMPDSYCLGSQYWAKNLHTPNYNVEFGILLDMVGAPNATFTMEGTSVNYANEYLHKVWKIGHAAGYSNHFSYVETNPITDDHLYINKIAGIPTIDIIHFDHTTNSGFGWYWHTHEDNLEAVSKPTLKAVGQTVLQTIYQEDNL